MHILHCLLPELSPKSIHYPQKAYIIPKKHTLSPKKHILALSSTGNCIHYPRFGFENPQNCIIILELKFRYPLIAYIILDLINTINTLRWSRSMTISSVTISSDERTTSKTRSLGTMSITTSKTRST